MPISLTDHYAKWQIQQRIVKGETPPPLRGCLEGIDASLWLIVGNRIPQALALLVHSIELAFKAKLENIHPLLVVDRIKYDTLKFLLRDALCTNNHESRIPVSDKSDWSIGRTITFNEAMKRVGDIYGPLINEWKRDLRIAYNLRNKITHYGADQDKIPRYAEIITTVCFPFLNDFLQSAHHTSLESFLTPGIYREINVAKNTAQLLRKEGEIEARYILDTVALKVMSVYTDRPSPETDGVLGEYEFALTEEMEEEINRLWFDDWWIKTWCRICDHWPAFIKVKPVKTPSQSLIPLAVRCPRCGLELSEGQKNLVEYHVGDIEQETVCQFFEEHGRYVEE
jgi:hypothetical protein